MFMNQYRLFNALTKHPWRSHKASYLWYHIKSTRLWAIVAGIWFGFVCIKGGLDFFLHGPSVFNNDHLLLVIIAILAWVAGIITICSLIRSAQSAFLGISPSQDPDDELFKSIKSLDRLDRSGVLPMTAIILYQFAHRVPDGIVTADQMSVYDFIQQLLTSPLLRARVTQLMAEDNHIALFSALQNVLEEDTLTRHFFYVESPQKAAIKALAKELLAMGAADLAQADQQDEANAQLKRLQKERQAQETIDAYFNNDFQHIKPVEAVKIQSLTQRSLVADYRLVKATQEEKKDGTSLS